MPAPHRLAVLLAILLAAVAHGQTTDADGDGLTADQELQLGTDPTTAETFEQVVTDPPPAAADPRRDVVSVETAAVAKGRWLWRVTFAGEYDPHSVLHLYLDTDDDLKTGRANQTGTDAMLSHTDGQPRATWYAPDGSPGTGGTPRMLILGRHVYLCGDLALKQVDGRSRYRLMVLSERLDPHTAVDSTPWVTVTGPGESLRTPVRLDADVDQDEGFRRFRGLPRLLALKEAQGTVAVSVRQAKLTGFREDTFSEYRGIAAVRGGGAGATIGYPVPVSGRFYLGVQLYDGNGAEKIRVEVDGRKIGYVVGLDNCRDLVLYASLEPVDLQAGSSVTLKALTSEGEYRVEELLLLKEPAPQWQPVHAIREPAAQLVTTPTGLAARVTFLTTWPVVAQVAAAGATATDPRPLQNHRLDLALAGRPAQDLPVTIAAADPTGRPVTAQATVAVASASDLKPGAAGEVALNLLNAASLPAGGWPVTTGVPLPTGQLYDAARARLECRGEPVGAELTATGWWPNGSIRWLRVATFLNPSQATGLVLRYGPRVEPAPLAEPPAPGQRGRLHYDLAAKQVAIDANGDGRITPEERLFGEGVSGLRLTEAAGAEYLAVAETVQAQVGERRTDVRVDGHWVRDGQPLWAFQVDLRAFAETSAVRIFHTFVNDRDAERFTRVGALRWLLPLRGRPLRLGGDRPVDLTGPAELRQVDDQRYELRGAGLPGDGRRAAGWAAVEVGGQPAAVVPRDFWQHWPKGLAVTAEGIRLDLLPPIADVPYGTDFYDLTKPDHRLYYCFDRGAYKIKYGCSKRHELWLTFGVDPTAAAAAVNQPPLLACTPEWYQRTRVFGDLSIATQQLYPTYEPALEKALQSYLEARERNREYGFLNFGDWYGERGTNWGNIEYDTQHAFLMQFARSGDWRWFACAEQAERHNQDVDTVWAGPNRGMVYAHCFGHVGDYLDRAVGEQGSARGGFTVSHTWCEGHCEYYQLTGDERAREAALSIADAFARRTEANYDYTNGRDSGWHLILTSAVYELTRDPYYLNVARLIVDRVVERQTPNGGWDRMLVPGHCTCEPPRHRGEAGFMVGVLLSGLKDYHAITGDPRVPPLMYRASKWLIADLWTPRVNGFRYTSCPLSSAGGPWSNTLLFEGMTYADRFHPDPAVRAVLRQGSDAALRNISAFGKSFSQQTRATPRILWDLERLAREDEEQGIPLAEAGDDLVLGEGAGDVARFDAAGSRDRGQGRLVRHHWDFGDGQHAAGQQVTHQYAAAGQYQVTLTVTDDQGHTATDELRVTVAPAWVRRLAADRVTRVEAEDFTGQGGGAVRLEQRVATSGRMVTGWHTDLGHWLEWTLPVKVAGRYQIALRYCTDSPAARRRVALNGQVPRPDLADAAFARTGGFSTGKDDYQLLLLGGEQQPWIAELPAGEHRLRLTNLGDGLGVDYLLLVRVD